MLRNLFALILSLLALRCVTEIPDTAYDLNGDTTEAIQIENGLATREGEDAPADQKWFQIIPGPVPIVISAPHSTKPMREGQRRFSDGGGTAAMAILLSRRTHVTAIYTNYASPSDPNFYDNNDYKESLKALITSTRPVLLLDIHGSHPFRPYEIDIGTMDGQSLLGQDAILTKLLRRLRRDGITNLSYNYFAASKNATITKFASNLGVPSVQLEINAIRVSPGSGSVQSHLFSQTLHSLIRYIEELKVDICKQRRCA